MLNSHAEEQIEYTQEVVEDRESVTQTYHLSIQHAQSHYLRKAGAWDTGYVFRLAVAAASSIVVHI